MGYHSSPHIGKGATAGFVGGLAATVVMSLFMILMGRLTSSEDDEPKEGADRDTPRNQGESGSRETGASVESEDEGSATAQAAEIIAEKVFNKELDEDKRESVGQVVHYAFGGLMGALYGAAAEFEPRITAGNGIPFGTAVWLGADEVALPVLNLSGPPTDTPMSVHASALVAHFIYGFCTDAARRVIRDRW